MIRAGLWIGRPPMSRATKRGKIDRIPAQDGCQRSPLTVYGTRYKIMGDRGAT